MAGNVLRAGPLRLSLQRLPVACWSATTPPRSWGPAPLHRARQTLAVPCLDDEALWLGAWLETGPAPGECPCEVLLLDAEGAVLARLDPARAGALFAIGPAARPRPIDRGGRAEQRFGLLLRCGRAAARLRLHLLAPAAWARAAGRPAPRPAGPLPPVPRLDTHPPRRNRG